MLPSPHAHRSLDEFALLFLCLEVRALLTPLFLSVPWYLLWPGVGSHGGVPVDLGLKEHHGLCFSLLSFGHHLEVDELWLACRPNESESHGVNFEAQPGHI